MTVKRPETKSRSEEILILSVSIIYGLSINGEEETLVEGVY